MTIRSRMGLVMGLIGPEHPELFARTIAELNLVYSLVSTDINQSTPNVVTMYVNLRSRMSSIKVSIGLEQLELFTLVLRKNAIFDFVYFLASTYINKSVPNFVKMFMPIMSLASSIMGSIRPE